MRRTAAIIASWLVASVMLAGCMGAENRVSLTTEGPGTLGDGKLLGGADSDGDLVPDAIESHLCDRELTADLLNAVNGQVKNTAGRDIGGHCTESGDFVPLLVHQEALIPTSAVVGPDADDDLLPEYVDLVFSRLYINTHDSESKATLTPSAETLRVWLDSPNGAASLGDDSDADNPIRSVIVVPLIPMGYDLGPDEDDDALPADLTLMFAQLVVDRRVSDDAGAATKDWQGMKDAGIIRLERNAENDITVGVDHPSLAGDDNDPDKPVVSVVTIPVALPNGGVNVGPDADEDDLPAWVDVGMATFTVDRRASGDHGGIVRQADADDLRAPLDGGLIGDDEDYEHPVLAKIAVGVPIGVTVCEDGDGDDVPQSATLHLLTVSVDRRSKAVQNDPVFGTDTKQITLDGDDPSEECGTVVSLVDDDGDLVPDVLEPALCLVDKKDDPSDGECDGDDYHPPTR